MKEDSMSFGQLHVFIISSILGLCGVVTCSSYEANHTLFVTVGSGIFKSSERSGQFDQLSLSEVGTPYGLDVDINAGIIFWTDTASYKIKRAGFDGNDFEVVTSTGSGSKGIAIDPNEREIYWVESSPGSIKMVNYDGSGKRTVMSQSGMTPMHIVVHASMRKLYWTTTATYYGAIRTSNCDGSSYRTLIAMSYNSYPMGIALNADGSRLYWCYYYYGYSLISSTIDGGDQRTLSSSMGTCRGIAWFEGDIYLTDASYNAVKVVNEQARSVRTINQNGFYDPRDVFVGRLPIRAPVEKFECDFENTRCGWTEPKNATIFWRSRRGDAGNNSIPIVDHTKQQGSGQYMFADSESRSLANGQVATLISPSVNASMTSPKCFRLWYYMNGVTNSSLKMFFQPQSESESPIPLWSEYGNHLDEWIGAEMEVDASGVGNILVQAIVDDPASSNIAIDDVQYDDCTEASLLTCTDTSMTVYLDRARLGISTIDDVSLKSSVCKGYAYDHDTIAITTDYDTCGTSLTESEDIITFSNVITVATRSGIRSSDIEIRVKCSLTRNYHVHMTYLGHKWIKYVEEAGLGNFSVRIQQYPSEKLHRPYPSSSYPFQVDEGDMIYIATQMSVVKDMVESKNSRCWATKSPDPTDSVQQELIQDGCPVGGSVHLIPSDNPSLQPFSFTAFSFGQEMGLIYVHCDVIVCHQSEASACSTDCTASRPKRGSRNVRDVTSGPHTVSQGPFISKPSVDRTRGGRFDVRSILLIVAGSCVVLLLIAVVVLVRNRK